MDDYRTKINENGRLVIPAACRKALDIQPGDEVLLRVQEDEIRISNLRHALKRARRLVKQYIDPNDNLVTSLTKDRRKEASLE